MENYIKESRKLFKEKVKNWSKEQKQTHLRLLKDHIKILKENIKLKEIGLKLYKENPYPLNPQFEYEKNEEYVNQKVKLTELKINQELKKEKEELEEFEWQIKYLERN